MPGTAAGWRRRRKLRRRRPCDRGRPRSPWRPTGSRWDAPAGSTCPLVQAMAAARARRREARRAQIRAALARRGAASTAGAGERRGDRARPAGPRSGGGGPRRLRRGRTRSLRRGASRAADRARPGRVAVWLPEAREPSVPLWMRPPDPGPGLPGGRSPRGPCRGRSERPRAADRAPRRASRRWNRGARGALQADRAWQPAAGAAVAQCDIRDRDRSPEAAATCASVGHAPRAERHHWRDSGRGAWARQAPGTTGPRRAGGGTEAPACERPADLARMVARPPPAPGGAPAPCRECRRLPRPVPGPRPVSRPPAGTSRRAPRRTRRRSRAPPPPAGPSAARPTARTARRSRRTARSPAG